MAQESYKNKKILVVDDEPDLLDTVSAAFYMNGFLYVDTASSIKEARQKIKAVTPDIALLDIMLPDGNGFSFYKEIRNQMNVPVIFLTARGETEDRIYGLGLGADDYIAKPFSPKELVLRLSAVLRRCYPQSDSEDRIVEIDAGSIDFSRALFLKRDGTEISLTSKECELLEVLSRNAGRIVTLDALCTAAWGENYYGYEGSLPVHIRRIREKIEQAPSKPISLLTVRGLGYKLITKGRGTHEATQ